MQNTMVRGGGWPAGEKIKLGVREKIKKGKEKRRKIKKGKEALKMHLFGLPTPPLGS